MSNDRSPSSRFILISRPSLQTTMLLQSLKRRLYADVCLQQVDSTNDINVNDGDLLLFDIMAIDEKQFNRWCINLRRCERSFKVLLFNTPNSYHYSDIVSWPMISAVFYSDVEEESLIEGIRNVCRGGNCFPKEISSYIMHQLSFIRPTWNKSPELTHREREILKKLMLGASNVEIANLLFISENTVKTHIYNLFRKISVKNRTQAVFWANQNLQ